jgi:hypothetical protein
MMAEMRLIDANALDLQNRVATDMGGMCFIEEVETAIEQAPTIDPESLRPAWIPVTERLPESECIAVGYQNEMLIGWVYTDKISETGYAAESDGEILRNVTHWMPLPEPPEE